MRKGTLRFKSITRVLEIGHFNLESEAILTLLSVLKNESSKFKFFGFPGATGTRTSVTNFVLIVVKCFVFVVRAGMPKKQNFGKMLSKDSLIWYDQYA